MLKKAEVVEAIKEIERDYKHVLNVPQAKAFSNAPRLLMQLGALAKLDMLYMVLNEKRPKFKCDGSIDE